MVGFGSSLRMARRSGWERAYLDYETLKLLLSQIEAVYEEEGHRQRNQDRYENEGKKKDYRDELFIESDSELAFVSSNEYEEELELLRSSDDENPSGTTTKPPFLTYSHEAPSSSDEGSVDRDSNCASGTMASLGWKSTSSVGSKAKVEKKNKRDLITTPNHDDQSDYFAGQYSAVKQGPGSNLFILQGPDGKTETTSLMHHTYADNLPGHGSSVSIGVLYPNTPPRDFYGIHSHSVVSTDLALPKLHHDQQELQPSKPLTEAERREQKFKEERRRQRHRRRRKLAQKRREREKKVPRHLRQAHAKARAITERFLGLLRAEVEKVTLFAQSRLGELADTAGSLRFPPYEDIDMVGGSSSDILRMKRAPSFENPLSDGGMHPSASSSDDEETSRRRPGVFPWSDESEQEDDNKSGEDPQAVSPGYMTTIEQSSSGAFSATTEHFSNVSAFEHGHKSSQPSAQQSRVREAALRQIAHFADIRKTRPLFQRIDHIVGEDLLLLSAVDEADGYIAVGVELMHILRFISINVIAVRKICRKHDRLLMNRMLGGYYHRKKLQQNQAVTDAAQRNHVKSGEAPNTFTLGGIVSRSLGDSNARQVFVTGINRNKLCGLYDTKIQELANSVTVQVISSSIALALSEYEVSHSRADALAKLNPSSTVKKTPKRSGRSMGDAISVFGLSPSRWREKKELSESQVNEQDTLIEADLSDAEEGPPSTVSTISLTRLRFTVVSIYALREVARGKLDSYKAFISRSSLVFTGANIIGEGLDGCSRDILDFFVSYSPDAALLLDSRQLYSGLLKGGWKERPIGTVMLSTLAMGVSPTVSSHSIEGKREDVVAAVSVIPVSGDLTYLDGKHKMKKKLFMSNIPDLLGQGINPATLRLNRAGMFLTAMNYYIVHSTATAFVQEIGANSAHSASIIGAASFGALIAALLQCRAMSIEVDSAPSARSNGLRFDYFRNSFLMHSLSPIAGNIAHAVGVSRGSILLAVFGRVLIGFGSTELLHRQLLSSCLPAPHLVFESANLVHTHLFGVFCGLMTGGFLALFNVRVPVATISSLHSGSYFMAACWFLHWINLFWFFQEPNLSESIDGGNPRREGVDRSRDGNEHEDSAGSSEVEEQTGTPESFFHGSASISTREDDPKPTLMGELEAIYGSSRDFRDKMPTESDVLLKRDEESGPPGIAMERRRSQLLRSFRARLRKILFHSIGIPVTLAVVVFVRISHEILFSSCAIITNRYFHWNGSQACFLLGLLSAFVIPINYVVERISRSYDERTVLKRAVVIAGIGLLVMVNYASFVNLIIHIRVLFDKASERQYHPYDWIFGSIQYLVGLSITYAGIMSMEPATLSLMSKLSPTKGKSIAVNSGTVVTLLSLAARSIGDLHILFVGLSHRLINTDIVNSLVVPLLLACLAAGYVVRRHFFFLI